MLTIFMGMHWIKNQLLLVMGVIMVRIGMTLKMKCLTRPPDLPAEEYERWLEDAADRYSDDYPTSQAKDAAAYAMKDIQKNVPSIIAKNRDFFQSLNDIKKIHIYGFSFAEVDIPYNRGDPKCEYEEHRNGDFLLF